MLIYHSYIMLLCAFLPLFSMKNNSALFSESNPPLNPENKTLIMTMTVRSYCPWDKQYGHSSSGCGICIHKEKNMINEKKLFNFQNKERKINQQVTVEVTRKPTFNIIHVISYVFREYLMLVENTVNEKTKKILIDSLAKTFKDFRKEWYSYYENLIKEHASYPIATEFIQKQESVLNIYKTYTNYPKSNNPLYFSLLNKPLSLNKIIVAPQGEIEIKTNYKIEVFTELLNTFFCACTPPLKQTDNSNMYTNLCIIDNMIQYLTLKKTQEAVI